MTFESASAAIGMSEGFLVLRYAGSIKKGKTLKRLAEGSATTGESPIVCMTSTLEKALDCVNNSKRGHLMAIFDTKNERILAYESKTQKRTWFPLEPRFRRYLHVQCKDSTIPKYSTPQVVN